jgi:uncharacterized coiled-coil protein SlyX
MQTEKNYEILAELCALRAGLSIISEKKGHIDKIIDDNNQKCTALVSPGQTAIKNYNTKIAIAESNKNSNMDEINRTESSIDYNGTAKKLFLEVIDKTICSILAVAAIGCALLAAAWVLCILPMEWGWCGTPYPEVLNVEPFQTLYGGLYSVLEKNGWIYLLILTAIPLSVMLVGGTIVLFVMQVLNTKESVKNFSAAKKRERHIKELNKEISNLKFEINNMQRGIKVETDKLNKINNTVKELNNTANKEANKIAADGDVVYRALLKTYIGLLDERDWKNLDYIIFSFETGRALTMKDALFYVDRECETERIVSSIHEANRNLCEVLRTEMNSFKSSMERSFYELNKNVRSCAASINETIINTGASIEGSINRANMFTQASIQNLKESINYNSEILNKALIDNINKPSNVLVDDVHELRRRLIN